MTRFIVAVLGVVFLSMPRPARAEPDASRATSNVLLQATGGLSCDTSMDLGYSALLGAGGRLPALPARLYVIVEASRSTHERDTATPTGTLTSGFTGTDVAGGLRLLMPVAGPLRLYADVLAGGTRGELALQSPAGAPRSSRQWTPLLDLAAGVDFQLYDHLSAGLRFKAHLLDPTPAWMSAAGGSAARVGELAVTLTLHF